MTTSPFGGCKPSHYGSGEIAVTTSSGEARHTVLLGFRSPSGKVVFMTQALTP